MLVGILAVTGGSCGAEEGTAAGILSRGTSAATPWFVVEGKEPGPLVVISGGVHGDEPAGARAAEQVRHWKIQKGRLLVLPRANVTALAAGKRKIPGENRDLNRSFPKAGEQGMAEGTIAESIWEWLQAQRPDWVIDLHEGYDFHGRQPASVGSSIIEAGGSEVEAMVPLMLEAVNAEIVDPQRKFQHLHPPVNGSLARAAAAHLGCHAMILETTTRDQALSLRVRQHRTMLKVLLEELGMLATDAPDYPRPREGAFAVALFDDAGASGSGPQQVEATLSKVQGAEVWRVGGDDVRDGALAGFDLVVFPGGSASRQAEALGEGGREKVRTFVREGGGYAGICAGAYLAATNYSWSLGISNHRTFCEMREVPGQGEKSMWYRGPSSTVEMELTEEGRKMMGNISGELGVRYHNGPIMSPAGESDLPEFRVLARFRSEVSHYAVQEGTMEGTPAILATECGRGRVVCISPHPESTPEWRPMMARSLSWAGRQDG